MNSNVRKYNVIIKAGESTFIKYRNVTNLLRLTTYLDAKHTGWMWYNVYDSNTRLQVASFTRHKRPTSRHV